MIVKLAIAVLASLTAGFINALAGGGTLITFPVLIALGISPVSANVTNTIALTPGFLGGIFAQLNEIKSIKYKLYKILPISILGGICGGLLLINTNESSFKLLIPYLLLIASLLFAFQSKIKRLYLQSKSTETSKTKDIFLTIILIFFSAIYGGYFGAGLGVLLIAVLSFLHEESLVKLNVLKLAISFSINFSAALYFCFSGKVEWIFAIIMIFGSILGGIIGGRLAGKINPKILKYIIITVGIASSVIYFIK